MQSGLRHLCDANNACLQVCRGLWAPLEVFKRSSTAAASAQQAGDMCPRWGLRSGAALRPGDYACSVSGVLCVLSPKQVRKLLLTTEAVQAAGAAASAVAASTGKDGGRGSGSGGGKDGLIISTVQRKRRAVRAQWWTKQRLLPLDHFHALWQVRCKMQLATPLPQAKP